MIVVVMGVSGCGKSTVGEGLARALGVPFWDADAYHPATNVAKMRAGTPLTDDDRWGWLDTLAGLLAQHPAGVLACSALKQVYRDRLGAGSLVHYVYLKGDRATLEARLRSRQGHFMGPGLLDSQLATLEEPRGDHVLTLEVAEPVDALVDRAVDWVRSAPAR